MRKFVFLLMLFIAVPSVFAQSLEQRRGRDGDWRDRRYVRRHQNLFEFTPFGGYTWGGTLYANQTGFRNDFDSASSGNFGANLGIPIGYGDMKFELMADRQNTHLQLGDGLFNPNDRVSDFGVTYYQAGLQIPLASYRSPAIPFIVIGAGVANLDVKEPGLSQETRFSASAGVGVKVPFNENVGLRLEARGFFTSLDNNNSRNRFNDYNRDFYQGETNLGVVISF